MRRFLLLLLCVLIAFLLLSLGYLEYRVDAIIRAPASLDLSRKTGSTALRLINSASDMLRVTGFEPSASATLPLNAPARLSFRYGLTSSRKALIYVRPTYQGIRVSGFRSSGSPVYETGVGEGTFEMSSAQPARCDALELFMEVGDLPLMVYAQLVHGTDLWLLKLRIPVFWEWK
ncbi:MAG TPA: hypothetical protein PKO06_14135 [Candidatus Ozemobacteraceae bacterium]|nr:hypothetical protein [Candidatus Ozemobacteraceae bacterium]